MWEALMTDLKTQEALLGALREASARAVTPEELHAQRVSFIMGSVKAESGITREQVQRVLAKQEGSQRHP
jgi:hypothetical protein